ncbi:hypothetical protein BC826DRAFT_1047977, partial [Russula brevipes]
MYQPHGRYRYAYGVNWRAAAAMIVSVTLTLPGLVNNINPQIHVGVGTRLFDIECILGLSTISVFLPLVLALNPAGCTAYTGVCHVL